MNRKYKGDDPIGRLVADFHQHNVEEMNYSELAESVRHFKKTKGEGDMSEKVERYANKKTRETRRNTGLKCVVNLMEKI